MSPGSASASTPSAACLVLGSDPASLQIEADLRSCGFNAFRADPAISFPLPGVEEAPARFRDFLKAALAARPDTQLLHPGTTPWADRPELPTLCQELQLTAIAPPRTVLSLFANRLTLLSEARDLGVEHLILKFDPLGSVREVRQFALQHRRYPFVLKSVRGDGDLTVFVVHSEEDIDRRLPLWMEQLQRNVGQSLLVPERYVESSRYIVAPFARLQDGTLHAFPLVDASLQSGFKRLIEFCPAEGIDAGIEKTIRRWTREIADHSRFSGVGCLHFLVDGVGAYLVGGSARLEAEYRLWESVDGASAVAWQVAAFRGLGERDAPRSSPADAGRPASALVARIFAEDPLLRLPQPGKVHELTEIREAAGEGWSANLSLGIACGENISARGDAIEHGLLGSLWVGGTSRKKALEGARSFLSRESWIAGTLQTNERYLAELVVHPFVRGGHFHAGFIDEEFLPPLRPPAEIQRLFATLGASLVRAPEPEEGTANAWRWAVGNVLAAPDPAEVDWIEGPRITRAVDSRPSLTGRVRLSSGEQLRVSAWPLGTANENRWQMRAGLWSQSVKRLPPAVAAAAAKPGAPALRKLSALVSGRVHSILYREGSAVASHEPLVVVESLRMLVPHAIPREGRIVRWLVKPEQQVTTGDELAEITLLS